MRVVHLSHDMEAIGRLFSPERALEAAQDRRDRTYDPALADLFIEHGRAWFERLRELEPWDAVLALEPQPHRMLDGEELDQALTVAADFIDMKSPYMGGHSRRCAELAAGAARVLGLSEEAVATLRRAALVHDFGATAVSNSIWDKPGPLTRTEFDRVELHPMLTEQMLRRSPALAVLNPVASATTRSATGRATTRACAPTRATRGVRAGRDRGLRGDDHRARRPPGFSDDDAAAELRRLEAEGVLEPRATRAVLVAAGHGEPRAPAQAAAQPGRAVPAGGRRAAARGARTHHTRDRRPARHLAQDRRPPHPEHLHQDQRLDPGRRRALGDAARRRQLSAVPRAQAVRTSPARMWR